MYFPDTSILEAELGPHPSQIWHSTLDGREVLKQGIIRRIGDGSTTNIWVDNWLPRDCMLKPIVCLKSDSPPQKVSDLIDSTLAKWKVGLIDECFLSMDASVIKNIPLCTRRQDDFWA